MPEQATGRDAGHSARAGAARTHAREPAAHPADPTGGPSAAPRAAPDTAVVTAAGIARLAGVGRAAVSNWRRRHPDFPPPVGGSGTSPVFSLAEVETWLRRQGKMAEVPLRERVWHLLQGRPEGLAVALGHAGDLLLACARDATPGHTDVRPTPPAAVSGDGALGTALRQLAEELGGPAAAYEFLLGRYLDTQSRHSLRTPAATADLMAELVGPARSVLDPACGSGRLLAATLDRSDGATPTALYGQEADPALARLAALRLALRHAASPHAAADPATVQVRAGDALRADAHPDLVVDAVLCHPPFNVRGWGYEELAGDPRWRYGRPARTESELAWVQHVLHHLAPGGRAVVLLPPASASRRSGRRIRAALLREGVLRAVIALPPGAAAPHNLPLHLWVLRRPAPHRAPTASDGSLLLVDAARPTAHRRGPVPWRTVRDTVLAAWRAFDGQDGAGGGGDGYGEAGRAVPVRDLLDGDVDLAPARHVPGAVRPRPTVTLAEVRQSFDRSLRRSLELAPLPAEGVRLRRGRTPRWPLATVGELVRSGALTVRAGGPGTAAAAGERTDLPVLTVADVAEGAAPSGTLPAPSDPTEARAGRRGQELVLLRADDVVVPVLGEGPVARVLQDRHAGAVLGRHLYLLRPDPRVLDPWFVAGFLCGSGNARQASSYASGAGRLDVRRLRLPRLPLAEQRRYGRHFRRLAEFEAALRRTREVGERLLRSAYDEVIDGVLPDDHGPG